MDYSPEELAEKLRRHAIWLNDKDAAEAEQADFSHLELDGMSFVNANLRNAIFINASCVGADFSGAELAYADFTEANLDDANLSNANAYEANFTRVDFRRTNFKNARLNYANFHEANGWFSAANFGKHELIAAGGWIHIGCCRYTYDHWLRSYEEIGDAHSYTNTDIYCYGELIKLAVERQQHLEKVFQQE